MLESPRVSPSKKLSPKQNTFKVPTKASPSPTGGASARSRRSLSPKFAGRHSILVAMKNKELQLTDLLGSGDDSLDDSLGQDLDMSAIAKPPSLNRNGFENSITINHLHSPRGAPKRRVSSIVYRQANGSSVLTDSAVLEQELKEMESRKSDISDSLMNFSLPEPFLADNRPKKGPTINDLYGPDESFRDDVSELDVDESEFFIGEEPQSNRSINYGDGGEDNSQTPSLYCDISVIKTSASDDQWAKYKLLGRVGMGEIRFKSKAAKKLINKSIRVMAKGIKQVMALRDHDPVRIVSDTPRRPRSATNIMSPVDNTSRHSRLTSYSSGTASTTETIGTQVDIFCSGKLLDEVKQAPLDILPPNKAQYKRDPKSIELPEEVKYQLKDYVTIIAAMYTDNAFHNFEHASEVLKSSNAILSFISMSEEMDDLVDGPGSGVITDPWTHLALVFSALIHDVDHAGVPNAQLTKEKSIIADSYKGKSVAEQNSIEIAWNLLMEPCYKDLREVMFTSAEEVSRFRRLVVIFVMATDIADQELAKFRKQRAKEALAMQESSTVAASGKATYIMETIMQAADVSHTMQPFRVYKKWNWKLYKEMYTAFQNGRAEKDPTETWYQGDINFFDFYIIPLAKQLITCGVMEESKVENLLNNAKENREEWAKHGERIVKQYVAERTRPKKEEGKRARRGSLGDSEHSISSAMSDLTDYDDLSACSLLDTTFDNIPTHNNYMEPLRPRGSTLSPRGSRKSVRRASSRSPGRRGSSRSPGRRRSSKSPGRRASSKSPGRKSKTKRASKKKGKTVGPPPLLNDEEMEQAAKEAASKTKGKSNRGSTGETTRKSKSQKRKSELAPSRANSVDSPRKGRQPKRKSEPVAAKKPGSRRHSVDSRRARKSDVSATNLAQTTPKRRSKKAELVLTGPSANLAPSPGEIVLPIRTNRVKKHARSKSSGHADKEEVAEFLKRVQATKEARASSATTETRKRCLSASRATKRSSTMDT